MSIHSSQDSLGRRAVALPLPSVYRTLFKRVIDIGLVLLAAPFAIFLLVPLAALVALDGARPLYRQPRVGRDGRVFNMLKLRTMVPDADALLAEHLRNHPEAMSEWAEKQKLRDDPRITRIGHILRRTSLDELPQLWNVLVGDMSLVGPRPMMTSQRQLYPGFAYYAMRPGITGYWQISKRNECSFAQRAVFDAAYFEDLSLGVDLSILYRTIWVVMRANGQ